MRLIALLLKKSAFPLLLSVLAGIAAGASGSAVLALVNENMSHLGQAGKQAVWTFLALAVAAVASKTTSKLLLVRVSTRVIRDMRVDMSARILRAPLRSVEKNGRSALLNVLTTDIHRIADALIELPEQCANATIALACFGYLFWLSWWLALVYVGIFAAGIVVYKLVARHAKPAMNEARSLWDKLISHYNDLIDGNKELKMHRGRRGEFMDTGMRPTATEMMRQSWRWNWILAVANAHTQMIFFALLGVALFAAPRFNFVDPHVLSGFILMSLYMGGPISKLVGAIPDFNLAEISLKKISKLGLSLSKADHCDVHEEGQASFPPFRRIEFRGLKYTYDGDGDEAFHLGPIDIRIDAGELVFVIGGNGSGKSSFARVLTGLYPHESGELLIDGTAVDDDNRDGYRQRFSTVFSDYHLFKMLYGMTGEEFASAASDLIDKLGLAKKVHVKEGELSTVDLSQGQRKRLALLTAFLEDRDIYLFDEWAADQDPSFKRVFYHEILPALKAAGKTVLVISHDNHYFERADRIVRFEEGRIVEDRKVRDAEPAVLVAS
jgi:putative ATP-binding cassette transporter